MLFLAKVRHFIYHSLRKNTQGDKKVMAKFFKWQDGRQGGGYQKMCLALSKRFNFDSYLIRYHNSGIKLHIDPSPKEGYEHRRMNIVLKKPEFGGRFMTFGNCKQYLGGRVTLFNPSDAHHYASRSYGERLILSLGWLKKVAQ